MLCKYDAWNRLVEIGSNIRYAYDGRNHRIKKTIDNVVTKSFFNHGWQKLKNRTDPTTMTYVWGLRYIDDLILREKGDERLYLFADPNWNVVATVDEDGVVQERFQYDTFGKVSGLTSDWNRTFTGQVLDYETALMLYRMRFYHAGLGRFVTRDPIGYSSNDINIFRYLLNCPIRFLDPYGKKMLPVPPIPNERGTLQDKCYELYLAQRQDTQDENEGRKVYWKCFGLACQ